MPFCQLIFILKMEYLQRAAEINGQVFRTKFDDLLLAGIEFANWLNVERMPAGCEREWAAACP